LRVGKEWIEATRDAKQAIKRILNDRKTFQTILASCTRRPIAPWTCRTRPSPGTSTTAHRSFCRRKAETSASLARADRNCASFKSTHPKDVHPQRVSGRHLDPRRRPVHRRQGKNPRRHSWSVPSLTEVSQVSGRFLLGSHASLADERLYLISAES